ncbi:RagB/SusD family nutrient uptake outer membrane protein [Sabulilitoribacter arenilitoris]|uniref:RagB/SusD family nutrient uptake outer membrane protein n=1 Tax=Wocania arenilitoris TaxID=2044858 RepID=A0AAE3JJJ1_9FLAO|nr:RagB/SusD family nutrient uptake outer membrane protein [Wocania arenilitoris]MCF7567053.1 RagB/SusD family nutrient uptake outer membrane protein [Wocania arenilitoris]
MKKIKVYNYYLLVASISLLLLSCNDDYLKPANINTLTEQSFWLTKDHATQGVIAAYSAGLQGWNGSKWTFIEEMMVAFTYKSDENWRRAPRGYGATIVNFTYGTDVSSFTNIWRSYYAGIARANSVIERVPGIESMEQADKDGIVGEAKFLRAFFHFQLQHYFKSIPLVLEVPGSREDFAVSQSTRAAVIAQVIQDLEDAYNLLPSSRPDSELGRVTKWTAKAMLGKTHLFEENWSEAATAFQDVVNNSGHALNANYEDNFNGTIKNNNTNETLFAIQWSGDLAGGNDERSAIDYEVTPGALGGWSLYVPSEWLYQEYMKDTTATGEPSKRVFESIFFDHPNSSMNRVKNRGSATWDEVADENRLVNERPAWWKKYAYDDDDVNYTGFSQPVIRFSDVLLMYAEALNEDGNTPQAIIEVNKVRTRAGSVLLSGLSQSELRQHIRHHERPIELAFEHGIRWMDTYRWAEGSTAKEPLKQTLTAHGKQWVENFVEGKHNYYPIPFFDISKNPNLVQLDNY